MRSPDNPFFARALVNRIWAHYTGVGLVHPVDDFSLANPPHDDQFLQLHVRKSPNGAFSGYVFEQMKERAILRFEGPLGTFYLREDSDKPMLFVAGGKVRHYALTDHKEFFAEMSESYFGSNDFFPFNRAELMTAEPGPKGSVHSP